MSACYPLVVSDDEMTTQEVAELLGVSTDTVRILVRSGNLPGRQTRPRGPVVVKRADAEAARDSRAAGHLSGPVNLTAADVAELRAREGRVAAMRTFLDGGEADRDQAIRDIAARARGYGTITELARVLDLHRTTVQRIVGATPEPPARLTADQAAELRDALDRYIEGATPGGE